MSLVTERIEEEGCERVDPARAFEYALQQIEACRRAEFELGVRSGLRYDRQARGGIAMTVELETPATDEPEARRDMWKHVLVGIDGSPASDEARQQATRLLDPGGALTLLSAYDVQKAFVADTVGMSASVRIDDDVQRETAATVIESALIATPGAEGKIVRGRGWEELIREAERSRAGAIAVGSHGTGRAAGIFIGSTATELVHKSPVSVLVARQADDDFPRSIVVGVDGSSESALAYGVAAGLAARFDARLWTVVAHGGKGVDSAHVTQIVGHRRDDLPDRPVDALAAVAREADLLVVGSRGLHGLRSLGSVSERVAHRVGCSVLIVRRAPWDD